MHNCLYTFLNDHNLVYSRQSGFRKQHSTEAALIKIIDDLLFSLDNDKVSGMVLVDYINISLGSWRDFARECFCVVAKP